LLLEAAYPPIPFLGRGNDHTHLSDGANTRAASRIQRKWRRDKALLSSEIDQLPLHKLHRQQLVDPHRIVGVPVDLRGRHSLSEAAIQIETSQHLRICENPIYKGGQLVTVAHSRIDILLVAEKIALHVKSAEIATPAIRPERLVYASN